jgi:alpha-1,2-mannosyltransferase
MQSLKSIFYRNYNFILLISLVVLGTTAVLTYFLAWQNSVVDFNRKVEYSDVMAYKNAGIFALQGAYLYGDEYTFVEGILMAWMMPPFAAIILSPLAFVPDNLLYLVWSIVQLIALLLIVSIAFKEFLDNLPSRIKILALIGVTFVAAGFGPNQDNFITGQINIILAALVFLDIFVMSKKNKKFEGFFIGIAAGIKILPGIFILYYLITKQWRNAANAIIGFFATIGLSALLLWENTKYYWGELAFIKADSRNEGFAITYFNQSLRGVIDRALGNETPQFSIQWLIIAAAILFAFLAIAVRLHNNGLEVAAISVVGLVLVLAAPTSWIHYGVWVVPAVGAILGNGKSKARTFVSVIISIPLLQQLMGGPLPFLPAVIDEWWVAMYSTLIVIIVLFNKPSLFSHERKIDKQ